MQDWLKRHYWQITLIGIGILYLVTHLPRLTLLPVFADEAIYIRWSQLIISDWQQYLFFPLNDGKTPLQMWLMVPFLKIFADPLFAGRFLSILVGFVQVYVIKYLIQSFGGGRRAQLIGMLMVVGLPFWYFHHRMALIDGLLALFLSITLWGLMSLTNRMNSHTDSTLQLNVQSILNHFSSDLKSLLWIVFTGVSFGLALLTKIPAIFMAPVFILFVFAYPLRKRVWPELIYPIMCIGLAGFIGMSIFVTLKLNPAFGQLFSRGGDFTYPVSVIIETRGAHLVGNLERFLSWMYHYIDPFFLATVVIAAIIIPNKRKVSLLLLTFIILIAPFVILGKTVHPRYLLPVVIPVTALYGLALEELLRQSIARKLLAGFLILNIVALSLRFMTPLLTNPDQTPFPIADRAQYLELWSSGHGILETVEYIEQQAEQGRVVVLTEGFFGTLPDGLLMYFFTKDVRNISIEGIGVPVRTIPDSMLQRIQPSDTVLLVVNSDRLFWNDSQDIELTKIKEFARPNQAPRLELYQLQIQ